MSETIKTTVPPPAFKRVLTPTIIQMEAVECGAAALAMILGYYGRTVPLEELRVQCGVSRDGSKASNIIKVARQYGLTAQGKKRETESLKKIQPPFIVFWNFNHFLVVEGFGDGIVYINDPAVGPRTVTYTEFDQSFTGVALVFEITPEFKKGGDKHGIMAALRQRLAGSEMGLLYILLVSLLLVIPGLAIPVFSRLFVDEVLLNGRDWLTPLVIGMVITAVLRAALTWLQQLYLLRMETKLALTSSSRFFWHILRLPIEFYSQRYAGEISTRVALNDQVAQLFSGQLATTLLNLILAVFYALLMFSFSVTLTLIAISIAALNMVALRYFARVREDTNQKLLQERGKLLGTSMGGLQTIETLKGTGGEADFFGKWSGYHAKSITAEQQMGVSSQQLSVIPPLLTGLNTVIVLAVGSLQVMDGSMSVGTLVAFQSLMASFLMPINQFVDLGKTLQEVQGSLKRLDDVLRYPLDSYVAAPEAPAAQQMSKLAGYLEINNLTFGYSRLEKPLIEEFSLSLKPGSRVALVGGSGSGKSTVARLVAGLYAPWSGEILFDGKPRAAIPRSLLTNSLSIVDQDIFLFEGTIRENLTLWDDTISQTQVVQAAKDAQIHSDIVSRPRGYDSLIEEGGRNFSGGQRQRLEIARALVGNPTLLVLDEATSALDPTTEKIIDHNLRRRGCTCLIIAHRLSTIRDCDEIIVMEQGKIVQRGTHEDMRYAEGPYATLIRAETEQNSVPA